MYKRISGRINRGIYDQMIKWLNESVNKWMDEYMNEWMSE
jgi:hypothetical protein